MAKLLVPEEGCGLCLSFFDLVFLNLKFLNQNVQAHYIISRTWNWTREHFILFKQTSILGEKKIIEHLILNLQ